ncbi:MAG: DUF2326 domain-containing protein [Ignavibacteria bacterium]|nr:DUF2326 domain-containing protein [Ignavibacteria bacterium]
MQLIKLYSNKDSFRNILFNENGLSIILAKQEKDFEDSKDLKKTYNSLGKSLSIALLHFCLGSNKVEEFSEKLADWVFLLDFKIGEEFFTSQRSCEDQNKIVLNGEELGIKEFNKKLGEKVFYLNNTMKHLSFRNLIPRFIRSSKSSYVKFDKFIDHEERNPFGQLLCNSYLLGLDVELIYKKFDLVSDLETTQNRIKNLEKEPHIKEFLKIDSEKDIENDLIDLQNKIGKLERDLKNFEVTENYNEYVEQANSLKNDIKFLENDINNLNIAILNIQKTLEIKPDIEPDKIKRLYENAKANLHDIVKKKLDEVYKFNNAIWKDRERRLKQEIRKYVKKKEEKEKNLTKLGKEKDKLLEFLENKKAISDYTLLSNRLGELKAQYEKLQYYKETLIDLENKKLDIKKRLLDENKETINYLNNNQIVEENIKTFKSLADNFYNDKPSSLDIKNNSNNNTIRFNIAAKIEDDTGDGVNSVKIFCFDSLLLLEQHNHNVKFLYHDSRLLAPCDSRQTHTIFDLASKYTAENNFQYIISCNQNNLDSVKAVCENEDEYYNLIEKNIVLELTDESNEKKLLGIQVDLNYEK